MQEVAGSETTRGVLNVCILNVICMIAMIATTVGVGLCGQISMRVAWSETTQGELNRYILNVICMIAMTAGTVGDVKGRLREETREREGGEGGERGGVFMANKQDP